MTNYKKALKNITTFILDADGVLSDGTVILSSDGEQMRTMHVRDGYALQLAVKKGYRIVILSGGHSEVMRSRFTSLGIQTVFLGVTSKIEVFREYISQLGLKKEEILYMGDDIPDYQVMQEVGLPTCPANACQEIRSISEYISEYDGGKGCVRDIIEQVMKVQGKWFDKDAFQW